MATITLSREQAQLIYTDLITIANSQKADGNVPAESLQHPIANSVDLTLSDLDLITYTQQGKRAGFAFNSMWYGDASTLKTLYAQLLNLDENNGQLDGNLTIESEELVLELDAATWQASSTQNWNDIIAPSLNGIFSIYRTNYEDDFNATGTAWIIDSEKLENGKTRYWLITNAHVADKIEDEEVSHHIMIENGSEQELVDVKLKGADHTYDIAALYFDSNESFPVLTVNPDRNSVSVGDEINVVGNPRSAGIIQNVGNVQSTEKWQNYTVPLIQDNSSAVPGNSGSPVFNTAGEVIGVTNSGESTGENFSIPTEFVLNCYQQIKQNGYVNHGSFEASYTAVDTQELSQFGVDTTTYKNGFYVTHIPNVTNLQEQLQPGDIILTYDDQPVPHGRDSEKFDTYISLKLPTDKISLTIFRNGKIIKVSVKLTNSRNNQIPVYSTPFGFDIRELDVNDMDYLEMNGNNGILMFEHTQNNNQHTYNRIGLITAINREPVHTIAEFKTLTNDPTQKFFVVEYAGYNYKTGARAQEFKIFPNPEYQGE